MFFFYTNPILIAAAVIPAIFLLVHVYRADKLEKEPAPLLISLVLYGIAATFIALILERLGSALLGQFFPEDSVPYNVIMYFGVVAFSEEGAKYFLLKRRTWNSAAFNCQFDGVVYAVFVALGFALWENISYVLMYGLSTALVRAVTAVPGHACFGVFMGVWYGLAKRLHGQGRGSASKLCRVLALLLPAFLHGCYDGVDALRLAVCRLCRNFVPHRLHSRQAPVQTRPVYQQLRRGISVSPIHKAALPVLLKTFWFVCRGRCLQRCFLQSQPRPDGWGCGFIPISRRASGSDRRRRARRPAGCTAGGRYNRQICGRTSFFRRCPTRHSPARG